MNSEDLSQTDNYKRGMSLWKKGNFHEAFKIIEKEAKEGHIFALYDLAGMHAEGIGTPKNFALYVKYCNEAAEKGCILARNQLGIIYEFGVEGVIENNEEKAINNYMQAAEGGLEIAIKNLGRILEEVTDDHDIKPSTPLNNQDNSISNVASDYKSQFFTAKKELFEKIDPNTPKNIAERLLKAGDDVEKVANCTGLN